MISIFSHRTDFAQVGTGHRRGVVPGRCSEGTHPGEDPAPPVLRRPAAEHRQRAAARSERSLRAVRGGQEVRQETRGREVELQAIRLQKLREF